MKSLATILYEDQRGETKEFGPHTLVVACVADLTKQTFWELRDRFDGRPMKGDSRVLQQGAKVEMIAPDCHPVVMLLDDDQIRKAVGLSKDTTYDDVINKIKQDCPTPEKLQVFLLDPNTERLVSVAAECIHFTGELGKDRTIRDRVLNEAAHAASAQQRDCILQQIPALKALVDFLEALVRPDSSR